MPVRYSARVLWLQEVTADGQRTAATSVGGIKSGLSAKEGVQLELLSRDFSLLYRNVEALMLQANRRRSPSPTTIVSGATVRYHNSISLRQSPVRDEQTPWWHKLVARCNNARMRLQRREHVSKSSGAYAKSATQSSRRVGRA